MTSAESIPAPAQAEEPVVPLAAIESAPAATEAVAPRQPAPVAPLAATVAFHAVSEHTEAETELHRPVRKRRERTAEERAAEAPLQLVETQVEAQPIAIDDELPRRTKPRRRRAAPLESGPLKLEETQWQPEDGAHAVSPTAP